MNALPLKHSKVWAKQDAVTNKGMTTIKIYVQGHHTTTLIIIEQCGLLIWVVYNNAIGIGDLALI